MFKTRTKNQAGFTLVELLVVIFIISLISGSVLYSSWKGQDQYYVSKSVQKLAADLRRAQNLALSGQTQGVIMPRGYGLYFVSGSQYYIFYNTSSDLVYAAGASVLLETINLTNNAVVSPIAQSIYFTPPDPTTYINGVNSGSLTLILTKGTRSKTITTYSSGKIDISSP